MDDFEEDYAAFGIQVAAPPVDHQPQTEGWILHFMSLFGPNTPVVPVCGTVAAIGELFVAVESYGLYIQPFAPSNPADNIDLACQHLLRRGRFPDVKIQRELHGVPTGGELPVCEGWDIGMLFKQPCVGFPAFKMIDIDATLENLQKLGKHHSLYTDVVLTARQDPVYQLGVITMTFDDNNSPCFHAQIFPARDDIKPTDTIWMYRWVVGTADGGYGEQRRAMSDSKIDESQYTAAPLQQIQAIAPETTGTKRPRSEVDDDDMQVMDFNLPPTEAVDHRNKRSRPDSDQKNNEPTDNLFTETPDRIKGETILRLARFYSNQELYNLINEGLAAKGFKPLKDENVVTRRITCAINSQAIANRGLTGPEIRKDLDDARKANGVKERMRVKTLAKKEANRDANRAAEGTM
ncbi:hypothetical protein LTR42_006392 [Elasticomyces elasticus]|nr:hypothetical protein LTR42_006392 [Elasticomyces elasticus]